MTSLRVRPALRALVALVAIATGLGPAWPQGKPPWDTPGDPFYRNPVGYARSLHERYAGNRDALIRERARLDTIRNELAPYRGTAGMGGLAAAYNDPDRFVQLGQTRETIARLAQEQNALEREWAQWCEWGLRLGPLSDANETIDDPYLDNTTNPATLKHVARDKIDFRIRYFLEKIEFPKTLVMPDALGQIESAGGAILVPGNPPGSLRIGQQLMAHGGSFPGKDGDQDIKVGPFAVPQACTIRGHVLGNPPVPNVWSLGNANTSMVVYYERRLGGGYASGVEVLKLSGQTQNNDLTGEGEIPGPGRITVVFGHPRGSGPLSGGNFAQSFSGDIVVAKLPTEVPAVARGELNEGDRIKTVAAPASILLPDGSHLIIEPNSEVTFRRVSMNIVGVNLERGKCRITRWGVIGSHGVVASVRGRIITPRGTDFVLTESGQGAWIEVIEGSVVVSGGPADTTLNAGQKMALPGGEVSKFDAAAAKPSLINGLPPSLEGMDDRTPQAYGDVVASFTGDQVGDGWLWEDPGADASVQTPERGTLRVTVPHLNDLWDARYWAPRLLHKATGDFDLEAELLITTKARCWVGADFLVKSPGSYLGYRKGQMVQDRAGAHYWIPAGLWGFDQGNPGKLTRLNQERPWQGVDAPDHPVRVRMTRRGDLWKAYWSVDGQTWNVCSVQDAPAPETVFAGWVFRRWAEDGPLGKEPGVFTLRDIRLRTEPLDTAESPAWDTFCQNAQVTAEGLGTRLVLDGKGPGEARAVSAGRLSGDFDVTIGYDTVQWTAQPGETRSWFVAAATGDEMWRLHIGGMRSDDANPQRLFSHARLNGTWGNYGAAVADAPKGRLRLVRKDEVVSTLYDVGEGWKELGVAGQRISEPLHLWLKASNDKAKTHVPFTVVYTIESVAPPLVDTDRLTNEKPGSPASQAATPATVTGSVVMCQQVDAQNNPIDPATVFAGP
ncbi:MAG: FecR domain-containing protein, partial [Armatimonadetes bacterium]|nr:FecR domain-containing protein [Armatimonadota bacterium]